MQLFMTDPKTKEPSVSLSMMIVSFLAVLIASGLNMAEIVKDTSATTELFYACAALYFGRKFTNKSGAVVEPGTEEIKS